MKYAVVAKDIQNLRSMQHVIETGDKFADLLLECDLLRVLQKKQLGNMDILVVEVKGDTEEWLEYLTDYAWEGIRPEVVVMLNCCQVGVCHKIEKLSPVYLLGLPFAQTAAESILASARQQRSLRLRYEKLNKQAGHMESHRQMIQQQFWMRLLNGQISLKPSDFMEEAMACGIEINLKDTFQVAILSRKLIKERNVEIEQKSRAALLRAADEWLSKCDGEYIVLEQLRPILLARNVPKEEFVYQCEAFIQRLEEQTSIPLCIYYDADVYCENLFVRLRYVMTAEKEDWVKEAGVYPAIVRLSGREKELSVAFPAQMESLIQNGCYLAVLQSVSHFLFEKASNGEISSSYLRALRFDMEQVILCVLKNKSIPAHKVMMDRNLKDLSDNAHISVESFQSWLQAVFDHIPQSE